MGIDPGDIRILLAAASPRVQISAKQVLIEEGYRVVSAVDGQKALELIQEELPALLITVLDLPHLAGPQLVARCRPAGESEPFPCLYLVQAADDRAFEMTPWDMVLHLPFTATELLEHVHALLEARERQAPPAHEVSVQVPKLAWQYDLDHAGEPSAAPPLPPSPFEAVNFDLDAPESATPVQPSAATPTKANPPEAARPQDHKAPPPPPPQASALAPKTPQDELLQRLPEALRKGDLAEHGLGALLIEAADVGFTGQLQLCSGRLKKTLQFRHGRPVFCSSNLLSETLGEYLFRQRTISSGALARSVEQMISDGIQQGEALVSQGAISREALAVALHAHVRRKVVNAFAWPEGEFRFEGLGKRKQVLSVEMQPVWLIADAVRLFTAPQEYLHFLDDHREDFVLPSAHFARHTGALAGLQGGRALLEAVDGQRRVHEIITRCKLDELFVAQLLLALHRGALIQFGDTQASTPAPAPRASDAVIGEMQASVYADWGALVDGEQSAEPAVPLSDDQAHDRDEVLELYTALPDEDPFLLLQIEPTVEPAELARAYEGALSSMAPERFVNFPDPEIARMASEVYRRIIAAYESVRSPEGMLAARKARVAHQEALTRRSHVLHADLRYRWGRELIEEGKPVDALKQFVEAGRRNPDEPIYLLYAGWAGYLSGRANEEPAMKLQGQQRIEKALEMMPVLPEGHQFLAQIHLDAGDRGAAKDELQRALTLDPNNRELRTLQISLEA